MSFWGQIGPGVRAFVRPEALAADVRYGARQLKGSPGFTFVCTATLAIGIGVATAIFSTVNSVLFAPLPYPHSERILAIWDFSRDGARTEVTFGTYRELVERSRAFEGLAVFKPWQPALSGAGEPERLDAQRVSARYFAVLGIDPVLGRHFAAAEDVVNGPRVAIISNALWRRRFGADPALVGRPILLDDTAYVVVGVLPPSFENVLAPSADLWSPLQYDRSLPLDGPEWGHHLRLIGRTRGDVTLGAAAADLDAIAASPVSDFPRPAWARVERGFIVDTLGHEITRDVRPLLQALAAAVGLLLLLACANVANLLVGRGVRRRGEFAMRVALGASRARLIQQLLAESLLMSLAGGALGFVLAGFFLQGLRALAGSMLPRAHAIAIDETIFVFACSITALVGLLVGVEPALRTWRAAPHAALARTSSRTTPPHRLTRAALVITQVALAATLLVGAGLLMRSLQRIVAVDPGFTADRVLTMQVQASGRAFASDDAVHTFFDRALAAVEHVPGVAAAAFTSQLPLSGDEDVYGVRFDAAAAAGTAEDRGAFRYAVTERYVQAMGVSLRRGRMPGRYDSARGPFVAAISESFARRRFPGQDPLGRCIRVGREDGPCFTIVGIVGDVRQLSLAPTGADAFYVAPAQWQFADAARWLVVRTAGEPSEFAASIRHAIWSVDPSRPIVRTATMAHRLAAWSATRRFALLVFQLFGVAALLLAALGVYGVLSAGVAERLREIGVRIVVGATPRSILSLVLRQAAALAAIGAILGLMIAALASTALAGLLFDISRLDPATYAAAGAALCIVGLMAGALPAWRAASVDPVVSLRAE